nr:uncharacterized protein LOC118682524 [Bactrocera oleae]
MDVTSARSTSTRIVGRSQIIALNPFLDTDGVLRVGGRLTNTDLDEALRYQIIIPRGALAYLLVSDAHTRCLHGGIQQMLQFLRQRFWLIGARAQIKSFIWTCTTCRRHLQILQRQQMASLPKERVLVAPPFSRSGLDYCGPFHVRVGMHRATPTTKTYAAIFVCTASRAVHIDLAEDLSTQAFIDVYDRFISRRGICTTLYSDNGTQFVGAKRQMQEDLRNLVATYAQQHLAAEGTCWKLITPSVPHHGGLWVAAVRSAKKHLLRVMGSQTLLYTEVSTLLTRIEACLNSRPLIALYDDPEGGIALTPGDFLIGRPLNCRPDPPLPEAPKNVFGIGNDSRKCWSTFGVAGNPNTYKLSKLGINGLERNPMCSVVTSFLYEVKIIGLAYGTCD